jgi:AbrB family looped-hinge helix DNA binding protein
MQYLQVKQKYQVTIPTLVRKAIDLHEGDTLEVKVENGHIILTPQIIQDKTTANYQDLTKMLGAGKDCQSFTTSKQVNKFMRNMRDEWK